MQSYIFIQYGYLSLFVKQARNEFLSKVVVALQTLRFGRSCLNPYPLNDAIWRFPGLLLF